MKSTKAKGTSNQKTRKSLKTIKAIKAIKTIKAIPTYANNSIGELRRENHVESIVTVSTRPITKEDIAFFESVPVVDMRAPPTLSGRNPLERATSLFQTYAKRFPIEQYEKYIGDVHERNSSYSNEDRTGTTIPPAILDPVRDLLTIQWDYPFVKITAKCIRIRTQVEGRLLDSICYLASRGSDLIECIVLGTRQGRGSYVFPGLNEFPLLDFNRQKNGIELELYASHSHIRQISKTDLPGLETGTAAVKTALSWNALFDPEEAFELTLEDQAVIRDCGRLSILQFLTKPTPRLSWYNSFGFQSVVDVNEARVAECQARIQGVPVSEIAHYLQGLLSLDLSNNVWFVLSQPESIRMKPSTEHEYIPRESMMAAVEAMGESDLTVKEFFLDMGNCSHLLIIPYESYIPIAYVDARGSSPVTHRFPCAAEFLYVEPRLAGNRVRKPKT